MLKFAPYPSYSLNLLNLFDLLFDSSLSPLIPLILDFLCLIPYYIPYLFPLSKIPFVFLFFFFVVLLPLVGDILWNIENSLISVESLSFIFYLFSSCFKVCINSQVAGGGFNLFCCGKFSELSDPLRG